MKSGLPTRVVADPRGAIWGKFIFNSVMNPIGAIVQGVNAARYDVPEMRALIDDSAAETPLTTDAGWMAQEVEAGRGSELEALTGYVIRTSKELGVPVPVTESV